MVWAGNHIGLMDGTNLFVLVAFSFLDLGMTFVFKFFIFASSVGELLFLLRIIRVSRVARLAKAFSGPRQFLYAQCHFSLINIVTVVPSIFHICCFSVKTLAPSKRCTWIHNEQEILITLGVQCYLQLLSASKGMDV